MVNVIMEKNPISRSPTNKENNDLFNSPHLIYPLIELLGTFLIFVMNVPGLLYSLYFGIENITSPYLLYTGFSILIASILSIVVKLISTTKDCSLKRLLMIERSINFIACISFMIDLEAYFGLIGFALKFTLAGLGLFCFWEILLYIDPLIKRITVPLLSSMVPIAGSVFFLWVNFFWWTPMLSIVINAFLLGGIVFAILLQSKDVNFLGLLHIPINLNDKPRTRGINGIYLFLGICIGLFLSLYILVSENLAINNQTVMVNAINICIVLLFLIPLLFLNAQKIEILNKLGTITHSKSGLFLGIIFLIGIIGYPWYAVTSNNMVDTTAGTIHLIGIIGLYILVYFFISTSLQASTTPDSTFKRIFFFIFGLLLGLAGLLFGGTTYRVGPEIGLAFTILMIFGTIFTWRISKKLITGINHQEENKNGK